MNNNEQLLQQFQFAIPIPMRWNDLDPLGHVNNIYYFEYFQIARGEYMIATGKEWDWTKHMFVIAHLECDYYKELTFNTNNPTVLTRTSALSNKSFEMEYLITSMDKEGNTIIHAKGKSVNVMIDMQAKKSIEIPAWLRQNITNYEPAL